MLQRLLKYSGIADREVPRLASMGLLYFLIFLGFGFGRSANESYFLKVAGAAMIPYMYIFTALITVFVSAAYSIVEDRLARHKLFYWILALFAGGLLWLRMQMPVGASAAETSYWLPFAVFSYYELLLNLIQIHFWTYANEIFDPREGKRTLPLIGGAGLVGVISGGLLVGQLMRWSGLHTEDVFTIWAIVLCLALPAVWWSRSTAREAGIQSETHLGAHDDGEGLSTARLGDLLRTPLIRTIALIQLPLWFVVNTVDWLFLTAMETRYPDDASRTAVLGTLNAFVALSGLTIQLLITGPLLRRFGVANSFLIYPISMTFASLAMATREFVPTAYGTLRTNLAKAVRFLDEGVLNSVFESSLNLLYNAIPGENRGQARALINGMIEPMAILIVGLLLVGFEHYDVSTSGVAIACAVGGLVWIMLARRVRGDYMHALVSSLNSRDHALRQQALLELGDSVDARTIDGLFNILGSDDRESAMLGLDYLLRLRGEGVLGGLTRSLGIVDAPLQMRIVDHLSRQNYQPARAAVQELCEADDPGVQAAAIRALGRLVIAGEDFAATEKCNRPTDAYLKSRDPEVRRAAIVAGLMPANARLPARHPALEALRAMVGSRDPATREQAAEAIRESGRRDLQEFLIKLARTDDYGVRAAAIGALGQAGDALVVPTLIAYANNTEIGSIAREALVRLREHALPGLHAALAASTAETSTHEADTAQIIRVLGEIASGDSAPALIAYLTVLDVSANIRSRDAAIGQAIHALGRIQRAVIAAHPDDYPEELARVFPEGTTELLRVLLEENLARMHRDDVQRAVLGEIKSDRARVLLVDALQRESLEHEDLALATLQLMSDPGMIETAAAGLRSKQRRVIAESIELLEGVSAESAELAEILETRYLSEEIAPPGLSPALPLQEILSAGQNPWTYCAALYAVGELGLRPLAGAVRELARHEDPLVRANAGLALRRLKQRLPRGVTQRAVDRVAEYMEHMLFLRSVPLFADIQNEDLQLLNGIARTKRLNTHQVIFREKDRGDALYVMLSGQVRLLKSTGAENQEQTELGILGKRECFGEMAIIDQEPRSATAEVAASGEVLMIKRQDFQDLLAAHPRLVNALLRTMSRRLRSAGTRYAKKHAAA